MAFEEKTLSYFQELEALKDLDVDQNKAFLDLLVFAVLADEEITDDELAQLDEELARLPFLWDDDVRDEVIEHSTRSREALESNIDDESFISEFLGNIAESITDPDERTVGLRMFCAVVLSDGITAQERQRCYQIGDLFEFHNAEVDEIIDEVSDSLAADDE
jgi:hypothetical protein